MNATTRAKLRSNLNPRAVARRVIMLIVTAVALYFVWPALTRVWAAWPGLRELDPIWFLIVFLFELFSFVSLWALMRIALQREGWFLATTSQLAGLAVSRIVPGGAAPGNALQYRMIVRAGVDATRGVYAVTAVTLLSTATLLAMPVLSLPAILGGVDVNRRLFQIGILGVVLFLATAVLVSAVLAGDRLLGAVGRGAQWLRNAVRRSRPPMEGLDDHLIAERDLILEVLGERWKPAALWAFGRPFLDYLALLAALTAVGADPAPSLVLLAYVVAGLLTLVPLTPGGIGFVEAGLVATLGLAGVGGGDATAATLIYRLVSYWLPIPAGLGAYVLYRRRYGQPGRAPGEHSSEPDGGAPTG